MKKSILSISLIFLIKSFLISQPALPNTAAVVTCFPDTTGYAIITVGPGKEYANLQQAINAATLQSVLILDAGVTFNGGFTLPNKITGSGWIILISSRMDLLPMDAPRINNL